mgnify:CR=1 FL=1
MFDSRVQEKGKVKERGHHSCIDAHHDLMEKKQSHKTTLLGQGVNHYQHVANFK